MRKAASQAGCGEPEVLHERSQWAWSGDMVALYLREELVVSRAPQRKEESEERTREERMGIVKSCSGKHVRLSTKRMKVL